MNANSAHIDKLLFTNRFKDSIKNFTNFNENALCIAIHNKDQLITSFMAITATTGQIFDIEQIYESLLITPTNYLILETIQ